MESNKIIIIKEIQNEIKGILLYETYLNLNVVIEASNNVRDLHKALHESCKKDRAYMKTYAKHFKDDTLIKHDIKQNNLKQQLDYSTSLDYFKFLKGGKYYINYGE